MNPRLLSCSPLALLWLILCVPAASADIYTFTDESGTPHFSNIPVDTRYILLERTGHVSDPVDTAMPRLPAGNGGMFKAEVERAASDYRVDAALLHAVITAESDYNPYAVSSKGAKGLMQLMPGTAQRYGVSDPFDPGQNIRGGAQYLQYLLAQFDNNLNLALAAFNLEKAFRHREHRDHREESRC